MGVLFSVIHIFSPVSDIQQEMRKDIFKGRKEKDKPRSSLETSVSICHQASRRGQWERYKGEGVWVREEELTELGDSWNRKVRPCQRRK